MIDVVYDTRFLASANGVIDASSLRNGNRLHQRISAIELFTDKSNRKAIVCYNKKLLSEYEKNIKEYRNDYIIIFFALLTDEGVDSKRSNLSRSEWSRISDVWDSEDRHLLAAIISETKTEKRVYTNEKSLGRGSAKVKREFRVSVCIVE
jgi:hypothetical protein